MSVLHFQGKNIHEKLKTRIAFKICIKINIFVFANNTLEQNFNNYKNEMGTLKKADFLSEKAKTFGGRQKIILDFYTFILLSRGKNKREVQPGKATEEAYYL